MKRLRFSTLFWRRVHKWVGLVVGLQLVLWAVSGAMMATLDAGAVGGHDGPAAHGPAALSTAGLRPPAAAIGDAAVSALSLQRLGGRTVYSATRSDGTRLFDAGTGAPIAIDAAFAAAIAREAAGVPARATRLLDAGTVETRPHRGASWRVDMIDDKGTSVYIDPHSGRVIAMRGDAWRLWDVFWMLHSMDYARHESFNHPLIVIVAFATLWLSLSGVWLLFKSFTRRDFGLPRR